MEFHFKKIKDLEGHLKNKLASKKGLSRAQLNPSGSVNEVEAAVLALFGLDHLGEAAVLITKRTESVQKHKGQMAFPGGHCEPEDFKSAGHITTALRETREEVGILESKIQILNQLSAFSTATGFLLYPVVGTLQDRIEDVQLQIDPQETAEALWVPLRKLREPGVYSLESIEHLNRIYPIHVYQIDSHRIWGATAAIIHHLIEAAF